MHVCRVLLSLLEAPRISWPLEAVCGYVWVQTLPSCKCLSSSTAYSPSTGTILLFQKRKTLRKFRTIWQVNVVLTCMNRWKVISGGTMVFYPGLRFPDGFHIHLLPKDWNVFFLEKELLLAELKAWLCFASNSARYILIHKFSPHNWTKLAFVAFFIAWKQIPLLSLTNSLQFHVACSAGPGRIARIVRILSFFFCKKDTSIYWKTTCCSGKP